MTARERWERHLFAYCRRERMSANDLHDLAGMLKVLSGIQQFVDNPDDPFYSSIKDYMHLLTTIDSVEVLRAAMRKGEELTTDATETRH